jgi:hypothetical protein
VLHFYDLILLNFVRIAGLSCDNQPIRTGFFNAVCPVALLCVDLRRQLIRLVTSIPLWMLLLLLLN